MGCSGSKEPASNTGEAPSRVSGGLTLQEIQKRIEAPKENITLDTSVLSLKYAYVSQRGYYPDSLDKPNQDSFSCIHEFGGKKSDAFFGVYDGHGKEGHLCAWFVRDNLPKAIEAAVTGCNSQKSIKKAITKAHIETNNKLHANGSIDDSLSGTTSISVLIKGSTIYVSNVGDSRAIIVSDSQSSLSLVNATPGKLLAKALSVDQTPYRKDERERVKKYGARILSMDQIDKVEPIHENWGDLTLGDDIDEGGDPPRVWSPLGDYPGTAFTRSFGDAIAEKIGVVSDPEILSRKLLSSDKFLVIASDGVFEFLTNQMVAEMVAQHSDDPLKACKDIVSHAYNLWLQYEVRTDDITIIIIDLGGRIGDEIDEIVVEHGISSHGSEMISPADVTLTESRPVRRALSREKKKNVIVSAEDTSLADAEFDISSLVVPKSEEDFVSITDALRNNFLFQHLNSAQRATVISVMQPLEVQAGEWVITQGDQGDRFYVIDSGKLEVRVQPPGGMEKSGGNVVHVYESGKDFHPGFGELSLMYGKPRAATVIALTPCKLWALDRRVFRSVVMKSANSSRRDIIRMLQKVELLKCLTLQQLQRLADLLNEITFKAGEYIIRQGEAGDNFYLIMTGRCDCTKNIDGEEIFLVQRKEHEYFGERALLSSEPRAANVKAATDVKLLYIGKIAFDEVLGSLADIINEDRLRREALAQAITESSHALDGVTILGLVSSDHLGPVLMGSFGKFTRNLTIRSFNIKTVEADNLTSTVIRFVDAVKIIASGGSSKVATSSGSSSQKNYGMAMLPQLTTLSRDLNAIHLLFNEAVVADLSSLLKSASKDSSVTCSSEYCVYIIACVVSALECLHGLDIVYRAVQPESLYVTTTGKIVLMDFRVCKLGGLRDRSYTICGAADYLAPEQISQVGHSAPVDFWALGVMLYELATGIHPFSLNGEVATYSKITAYGSKSFPELPFVETVNARTKALVNKLVVSTPEARLGVAGGFAALKKHIFFDGIEWSSLSSKDASPLKTLAQAVCEDLEKDGVSPELIASFSTPYESTGWDADLRLN